MSSIFLKNNKKIFIAKIIRLGWLSFLGDCLEKYRYKYYFYA